MKIQSAKFERLIAKHLSDYIKEKKTQEECIGFIAGFTKAMELK